METFLWLKSKYLPDQSAVAGAEFALVAPILIMMLIGTVDIGFFVWERMRLQNAAHAVAEYVSFAQTEDMADANVDIVLSEAYSEDSANVTVTSVYECECADGVVSECPAVCVDVGDYSRRFVDVVLTSQFTPLFPYPGIPDAIDLQGQARMRVD